jgi:hypothetical protein
MGKDGPLDILAVNDVSFLATEAARPALLGTGVTAIARSYQTRLSKRSNEIPFRLNERAGLLSSDET